jgi:hypothetical protein
MEEVSKLAVRCRQSICQALLTSQLTPHKDQINAFVNGEGNNAPHRKAKVNLHG